MAELVPSERELEILKVLWEIGSGSVREVHAQMCPQGELAFNTIQTLLRIMDEKGLVGHRAKGARLFTFRGTIGSVCRRTFCIPSSMARSINWSSACWGRRTPVPPSCAN